MDSRGYALSRKKAVMDLGSCDGVTLRSFVRWSFGDTLTPWGSQIREGEGERVCGPLAPTKGIYRRVQYQSPGKHFSL